MTATVRGFTLVCVPALSTIVVDVPAAAVVGDQMVLCAAGFSYTTTLPVGTWRVLTIEAGGGFEGLLLAKEVEAGDIGGSVSFDVSPGDVSTEAILVAIADSVAPEFAFSFHRDSAATAATLDVSLTGVAGALALYFGVVGRAAGTPTGLTLARGTKLAGEEADAFGVAILGSEALTDTATLTQTFNGEGNAGFHAVVVLSPGLSSNDPFSGAESVLIPSDGGTYISPLVANTTYGTEIGEPVETLDGDTVASRSAWWVYTPRASGSATFDTQLTPVEPDTVLVLYTGATLAGLTMIGIDDDSGGGHTSLLSMSVEAGTTYYVRVGTYRDPVDSVYVLRVVGPHAGSGALVVGTPPIDVDIILPSLDAPLPSNDMFASARVITVPTNGTLVFTGGVDNSGFSVEAGEDPGSWTAWWIYQPIDTGPATFDTSLCTGAPESLTLTLYQGTSLAGLSLLAEEDAAVSVDPLNVATIHAVVHADLTYYLRLSTHSSDPSELVLSVAGPRTIGADEVPAIEVYLTVRPVNPVRAVYPPPIQLVAGPVASTPTTVGLDMVDPEAGAVLVVASPVFTLNLHSHDFSAVAVTVQYDEDPTFATPVVLTADVDLVIGVNPLAFPVSGSLVTGQVYYWRARLTLAGVDRDWLPSRSFRVDPDALSTLIPITWTVAAGTAVPHLWFACPADGEVGDLVTVFGQGLGSAPGAVRLADVTATVTSWDQIADTGATTARAIDGISGSADCEHDEIVITVPEVAAPGGALVVEV